MNNINNNQNNNINTNNITNISNQIKLKSIHSLTQSINIKNHNIHHNNHPPNFTHSYTPTTQSHIKSFYLLTE
jgi:hypothetical protein